MIHNEYRSQLNQLPAPTNASNFAIHRSMFIGCGGLGFDAVNLLKKRVMHYFANSIAANLNALKFLSIDSANAQHQGTESFLDPNRELIRLDIANWQNLINIHPGVREWFPSFENMKADIRDKFLREFPAASKGCGTTRIFGRLGVFSSDFDLELTAKIENFAGSTIEDNIPIDGSQATAPVIDPSDLYFYIISTIGGGTGTGIFMDVAALIRAAQVKLGRRAQTWHIYGILVTPTLLTRTDPPPSGGIRKLNANSYAAIKELTHFLDGNRFTASHGMGKERQINIPCNDSSSALFNVAFLIDGESQKGFELKNRLQVANFISGMAFQLSLTAVGEHHFQRLIDQTMRGIFDKRLPSSSEVEVIAPQRPSFAGFGWATIHIPLEEMIKWAQIAALDEILTDFGAKITDADSEKISQGEISTYFFSPAEGAEKEKFIDKSGLTTLFDPFFWKRQARKNQDEKIDQETDRTRLFNFDFFNNKLSKQINVEAMIESLMTKSMDDILGYVKGTMDSDIDDISLHHLTSEFTNVYLAWNKVKESSSGLSETSKLSKAIQDSLKIGPQFTYKGLKALDIIIDELKERTNDKIEDLKGDFKRARKNRNDSHEALELFSKDIFASIRWIFHLRKPIADEIELFLERDNRTKKLKLQMSVLEQFFKVILPAYEDQIEKWRKRIYQIDKKIEQIIPAIDRLEKNILHNIGTSTKCEFNVNFSASMREYFFREYAASINLEALKHNIRISGLKWGTPPEDISFIDALEELTSQELIEQILEKIAFSTEAAREKLKDLSEPNLFRIEFDNFTSKNKNTLFWDSDNGGDIQYLHSKLNRHGEIMVKLSSLAGEKVQYSIADSKIWKNRMEGTHYVKGLYPHKVSSMKMQLGFAPFQLFYINEWYKDYHELLSDGEPLHIFKDAEKWDEPYTVYYYNKQPNELFTLACMDDFGAFIRKSKNEKFKIEKVAVDRFQGSYCFYTIEDSQLDIINEIHANKEIYLQLCRKVVPKLLRSSDSKDTTILGEGWIPYDQVKDLIDNSPLGKMLKSSGRITNPQRLFEVALEKDEIKKSEAKEGCFRLKVTVKPKTPECDWYIEENMETILNELAVNEPLFEKLCLRIIAYVILAAPDPNKKNLLLKRIFPLLPPHFKEQLEIEYPEVSIE